MKDADYRKINDRSQNSSKYHKKDETNIRAKLKEVTRREVANELKNYNKRIEQTLGSVAHPER